MSVQNDLGLINTQGTGSCGNNFINAAYSKHPRTVLVIALLASYTIPRVLDPEGGIHKRPLLKRFFTITLPDNVILATLIVAKNIPNLAALQSVPTLLATIVMIGGVSQVLELSRTAVAWGVDALSEMQNLVDPNYFTDFSRFIGPRDRSAV